MEDLEIRINSRNYNYKEEIVIDADALDVEWLHQPQLFIKYGEACVSAELKYDKAKEYLEFIKADLDSEIRSNPVIHTQSDKKPTEGRISSLILINEKYKEALTEYNKAKKQFKILSIALKAFDQRKYALENLVRLHGQSYFSSPSIENANGTNSLCEREEFVSQKVQAKIRERLNKKKKEGTESSLQSNEED